MIIKKLLLLSLFAFALSSCSNETDSSEVELVEEPIEPEGPTDEELEAKRLEEELIEAKEEALAELETFEHIRKSAVEDYVKRINESSSPDHVETVMFFARKDEEKLKKDPYQNYIVADVTNGAGEVIGKTSSKVVPEEVVTKEYLLNWARDREGFDYLWNVIVYKETLDDPTQRGVYFANGVIQKDVILQKEEKYGVYSFIDAPEDLETIILSEEDENWVNLFLVLFYRFK